MAVAAFKGLFNGECRGNKRMERKSSGKRRVFVQTETGCVLGIELDRSDNAHTVKRKLQLALNVPTEERSLIYGDAVLKNDLSTVRNDSPLLLQRNFMHRSSSTPCLSPTGKDLQQRDHSGPIEILVCSNHFSRTKKLVKEIVKAMKIGIDPIPVCGGLGGAYYFRNCQGENCAIVKPTDEEPYAPNNPKGFVGKALGQPGLKRSVRVGETGFIKIREEKRKREFDGLHNYPAWAKVLENACKDDAELRAVLGDSIGDPELMRKRVEERVRKKGRDFHKQKTGSVLSFKVSFRDFNPLDSYIWIELYGSPSDQEVNLIGSVIQSWYVMGRLGAFNSSNLQLANASMEYDPLYDEEKGFKVMPSSFHDISDVEFQDNWGRVWVDLGTSDFFSIDVLLNCMTVLSADYLGIQQIVFGGRCMGDWEEGMTNPDYGYKYFKI